MKAATFQKPFGIFIASISIHAAREGGDRHLSCTIIHLFGFQSTPPVKAATILTTTI